MKLSIPGISRWAAMAALLLLLAACVTGPRVRTDFDPDADFGRYRTYAFYRPLAMESSGYSTYYSDRVKASVRREMEARGYTYSDTSPDLLVNFEGVMEERVDVYHTPMFEPYFYGYGGYGGYRGYGYGARAYFGGPYWYDAPHVRRYTEGTLRVDVVEAARNRLVWTGDAVDRITRGTPQERALQVDHSLTEIFARYPYRAGSALPVTAE